MSMFLSQLERLNACMQAREWVGSKSAQEAWDTCERPDWMLWLAGKLSGDPESTSRRKLVLCVCACARTGLKYVTSGEDRPLKAIKTAEAWARNGPGVSLENVRAAARAARAAARAAWAVEAAAEVARAARAAAWAAWAAEAAAEVARAARAAAWAAEAAVAAARAAEAADKAMCGIIRRHYPIVPVSE